MIKFPSPVGLLLKLSKVDPEPLTIWILAPLKMTFGPITPISGLGSTLTKGPSDQHWGELPTLRANSWTYSKGSSLIFQVVSGWGLNSRTSEWQYSRSYGTRKGNILAKQWTKDMEKVSEPSPKPVNPMPI